MWPDPVDQRGDTGQIGDDTPTEHAAWHRALAASGCFAAAADSSGGASFVNPITHQTASLHIDQSTDYVSDVGHEVRRRAEARWIQ